MTATEPFGWDPHLPALGVVLCFALLVVLGHRRLSSGAAQPIAWTRREVWCFAGGCVAAVVATGWPVAGLAAHWSLTLLVVQRLLLCLAVAPLLLLGLPYDVIQWATRPRLVDAVLTRVERPPVAVVVVTVVVIASMSPALVKAQASSAAVRGALDLAIVTAGLVLWIPVIGRVPGIHRPAPVARFAYLVIQAVVPAFLSFVYILSRRTLYPTFSGSEQAIGLRPLTDQQVAGFVSKLTMLLVLLVVGAVVLAHAARTDEEAEADEPLVWADVERELERAARRDARHPVGPDGPPPPAPGDRGEHPPE